MLIVDDEPDVMLMLRVNLEADGYETVLAADGERALEKIDSDAPDIVLLDVMMPVMDGWGVLEALTRRPSGPPVVILSARSGARDIERAIGLGAVDCLAKPFELDEVSRTIEAVLASSPEELDARRHATVARAVGGA
ncbi:MAG TPA: response regulator [Acidimicrobiales bacterium]|nr:response regulator [Acidimicrobiales bacterium]